MDGYGHENLNSRGGGGFLYGGGILSSSSSVYGRTSGGGGGGGLQFTGGDCSFSQTVEVKAETWQQDDNPASFRYGNQGIDHRRQQAGDGDDSGEVAAIKAKIIAHPQYSNLLQAYLDCQKVGAPPETVAHLPHVHQHFETRHLASSSSDSKDPELDHFMEAYCNILHTLHEKLANPTQEAMEFIQGIETQLGLLIHHPPDDKSRGGGCSPDDNHGGEGETGILEMEIDPRGDDSELKSYLLSKYRGYLSGLKNEFSKKKKKGKLPKEARHKLLTWWELHYKWPYPSESEKWALGEATGLDQKQINNWFINQRKRHWKPSEPMRTSW